MPGIHAKLSASGSKKWLNCPGSLFLESQMPNVTSSYAEEGTVAHALGEAKIKHALKQYTRAGYYKAIKGLEITPDMEKYTDDYRDFVIERFNAAKLKTPDAKLLLEQSLDYSPWAPEGFGTGDVVIVADDLLEIIDLKYGVGVSVAAADNSQLKLYALGAINEFEYMYRIGEVEMTIFQPRVNNIDCVRMVCEDLLEWGESIKPIAKKAYDNTEEYTCGEHCDKGFCRAIPICRVYGEKKLELARHEFKRPAVFDTDEIADIIEQSENLTKWANMVKDYALDQAINHGVEYPGYKLVEGRSNRKWCADEAEIADKLADRSYKKDEVYPRKLKTITEIEKILGKSTFNELLADCVVKPPGSPTLVPMSDNRRAINSVENAIDDFKNDIEKGA